MRSISLAMMAQTHQEVSGHLFPGDGLEAAGILLCNNGSGKYHHRLVVAEFIFLPHEMSARSADGLVWPFEKHLPPARISEIDRLGQSIITVHSHPGGKGQFSKIDDRNDRELFESVNAWFNDTRINGAAIMIPDGTIVARAVLENGEFLKIQSVNVVGEEILVWKDQVHTVPTAYGGKLAQTLGQGTLQRLRGMRVGVVGCSGTGSIVIELLVRNCVGELVIVDDDVIEAKNLNRIVNGTKADADKKRAKVNAIADAIQRAGLETGVEKHQAQTDSKRVVSALIDCDVIFGCVDSARGRYHLECIASAYLIPYFDVGVNIEADGSGSMDAADAVAHYVHPGGCDLLSRGAYSMDQVTAEDVQRTDPENYERRRIAGYLEAVGEEQPAVMSVNMQAACMAFNDFVARIHSYRLDEDRRFATQRFRLVHGHYECEPDIGVPNKLFRRFRGTGDKSILVRNNTRHD